MWKGHHRGPESLEEASPYFQRLIDEFSQGDPEYVRRFLDLWDRTPPREPDVCTHYRIVWQEDAVGEMRFLGVLELINLWESLGWNDWVPIDTESWDRLTRLLSMS